MHSRRPLPCLPLLSLLLCLAAPASASDAGVVGFWKEPGGAVIHIEPCGPSICATLVALSPAAPSRIDSKNPDRNQQHRSLCGLRIGSGFHPATGNKAEGGTLYDPKSGHTYHGVMSSAGDHLNLRGYIGISLFGRSETWTRTTATPACQA